MKLTKQGVRDLNSPKRLARNPRVVVPAYAVDEHKSPPEQAYCQQCAEFHILGKHSSVLDEPVWLEWK